MEAIAKIWVNLWGPLSALFTWVVLGMMVVDLVTFYWRQGSYHRQFTGLMTGTGILGTFFGVVVGLQDFNPAAIEASIGPLLDGLKVSFATSVAGIFAAICTEGIETLFPSRRGKTGDPVADILNKSLLDMRDLMESSKKANLSVADNVAGLRTEMRDESAKVREALDAALKELAHGATEEIITALENVIRDFNNNLSEQFGENFKQLNAACLQLVEWQATYQEAVESANRAIDASKVAIDGSRELLEAAVPQKEMFYEIVKDTGQSIESLTLLNERLGALAGEQTEMLDGFTEALELVKGTAVELESTAKRAIDSVATGQMGILTGFTQLTESAETGRSRVEQMLNEHARGHKLVSDNIEEVVRKLGDGNKELQGHLEKSLNQLENSLASLTRDFGAAYSRYVDMMRKLTSQGE